MFSNYADIQKKFYNEIVHAVKDNSIISHAYFIETKMFENSKDLVVSLAKFLFCSSHVIDTDECKDCNICNLVDSGSFPNLQIIEPDGLWIKKEQIADLKSKFSEKSANNNYQIYIIYGADKLNSAAANSLLKFLEEPEEGIIAILVAENRHNVIETILSRCQIYTLENSKDLDDNIDYDSLFSLILNIEKQGCEVICYLNDLLYSKYNTRDEYIELLGSLESVFMEVLNFKLTGDCLLNKYIDNIKYICDNNEIGDLTRKISLINNTKQEIKYNVNINLLFDKFIINYVG